ncbi:MAG TPA: type II toxin-antitoxin system PrlF family antitoxin [Longimicrobium sp.]
MSYSAKATTVGNSRAFAVEAAMFRAHPELTEGRFEVHVIGPGTLLFHAVPETVPEAEVDDPVIAAWLAFIERDMLEHPDSLRPFDPELVREARELVKGIAVDLDEDLGDVTLP